MLIGGAHPREKEIIGYLESSEEPKGNCFWDEKARNTVRGTEEEIFPLSGSWDVSI